MYLIINEEPKLSEAISDLLISLLSQLLKDEFF